MARAHFRDSLFGATSPPRLLVGATVAVYEVGTTTPISQTLYAARTGSTTKTNPITTGSDGLVEFWLDERARVDLSITHPDMSALTVTVEVDGDPSEDVTETANQTVGGTKTYTSPSLTSPSIQGGTIDGVTITNSTASLTSPSLSNPTVTGVLLVASGTSGAPSIARSGDTDTGLNFASGGDKLSLVVGATEALVVDKAAAAGGTLFARRLDHNPGVVLYVAAGDGGASINSDANVIFGVGFLNPTASGSPAAVSGVLVFQGGTGGFATGVSGVAQIDPGWSPGSSAAGAIGVAGKGTANKDSVSVWGGNLFAESLSGRTNVVLTGLEIDLYGRSGSTVLNRYGLQIVAAAAGIVQGSSDDMAIRITGKSDGTNHGAKFKDGIVFDDNSLSGANSWAMDPSGVLMRIRASSAYTVARGIDLTGLTYSDASLKAPGFKVTGSSRVAIGDVDFTPTAVSHHRNSAGAHVMTVEADNPNRLSGQLRISGLTSVDKRLYVGINTSDNWGLIQAHNNAGGTYPLVLQPIGGVVVAGDPANLGISPDTAVQLHICGAGGGAIAFRVDGSKTSTTAPSAGGAGALPATPLGYLHAKLGTTEIKWPYYAA